MVPISINFIKICILFIILSHANQLNNLQEVVTKEEKCVSNGIIISKLLETNTGIIVILLLRILYILHTYSANQIQWNFNLFEITNISNKYNIMKVVHVIKILYAINGVLSINSLWDYYFNPNDNCFLINEFIGFDYILYFIISFNIYYYFSMGALAIVIPVPMFKYFDALLEKMSHKKKIKIYCGDTPECCVCYETNYSINSCGHLICKNCAERIINKKCPLCNNNISLIK
jgi:hypothetical protein